MENDQAKYPNCEMLENYILSLPTNNNFNDKIFI